MLLQTPITRSAVYVKIYRSLLADSRPGATRSHEQVAPSPIWAAAESISHGSPITRQRFLFRIRPPALWLRRIRGSHEPGQSKVSSRSATSVARELRQVIVPRICPVGTRFGCRVIRLRIVINGGCEDRRCTRTRVSNSSRTEHYWRLGAATSSTPSSPIQFILLAVRARRRSTTENVADNIHRITN